MDAIKSAEFVNSLMSCFNDLCKNMFLIEDVLVFMDTWIDSVNPGRLKGD